MDSTHKPKRWYSLTPFDHPMMPVRLYWWRHENDASFHAYKAFDNYLRKRNSEEDPGALSLRFEWGELLCRERFTSPPDPVEAARFVEGRGGGVRWYSITQRLGLYQWGGAHDARQAAIDEALWLASDGEHFSPIIEVHLWPGTLEQKTPEAEWGELVPIERAQITQQMRDVTRNVGWQKVAIAPVKPIVSTVELSHANGVDEDAARLGFKAVRLGK